MTRWWAVCAGAMAWLAGASTPVRAEGAVEVRVVKGEKGWQLLRDGKPYFVKGAGGSGSLEALAAAGANSVRTWDAEGTDKVLDEAQRRGLTVCQGIWLGQERQGFDYNDVGQVAKQADRVRTLVQRYKDHPALLCWGIGNEMEGTGDNAAIWSAIQNLAAMVHRLDPKHPVMTVIAEVGGAKVAHLHKLCPDIDIVGINSYAGCPSLAERYARAGGSKPYIVTEFGPPGAWEVDKTAWGAPIEPTSTEKAAWYRRAYEGSIAKQPLCLGSYAFLWGHKQETTATWYGLLLPDGSRTGAVDTLSELWTGKPPASRCPTISSLKLEGPDDVDPGSTVRASLQAAHPEGLPLKVAWALQPEAEGSLAGGDAAQALPTTPGAIARGDLDGAEVRMPAEPGGYRLFVTVRDGKGGAAVANVPIRVKGEPRTAGASPARLPLVVYDEAGSAHPPYAPSGWMGNAKAVKMQQDCSTAPHSGKTCLRFDYTAPGEWAGVVWQHPANDWGERPGGWNLTGAKKLTFWARGEKGGEVVSFEYGILGRDKRVFDTSTGRLSDVKLTPEWKQYSIDLAGKDLTRIKTGFAWVAAGQGAPVAFYLDDIRFE